MKGQSEKSYMSLAMVGSGRDVTLVEINAGRRLKQRLANMGLVPGTVLRVVSNGSTGPFVVAVKETRIMLGRGMAHKMLVT